MELPWHRKREQTGETFLGKRPMMVLPFITATAKTDRTGFHPLVDTETSLRHLLSRYLCYRNFAPLSTEKANTQHTLRHTQVTLIYVGEEHSQHVNEIENFILWFASTVYTKFAPTNISFCNYIFTLTSHKTETLLTHLLAEDSWKIAFHKENRLICASFWPILALWTRFTVSSVCFLFTNWMEEIYEHIMYV